MPAADTTLYANFARAIFYDGFEGMNYADRRSSVYPNCCVDMNPRHSNHPEQCY